MVAHACDGRRGGACWPSGACAVAWRAGLDEGCVGCSDGYQRGCGVGASPGRAAREAAGGWRHRGRPRARRGRRSSRASGQGSVDARCRRPTIISAYSNPRGVEEIGTAGGRSRLGGGGVKADPGEVLAVTGAGGNHGGTAAVGTVTGPSRHLRGAGVWSARDRWPAGFGEDERGGVARARRPSAPRSGSG